MRISVFSIAISALLISLLSSRSANCQAPKNPQNAAPAAASSLDAASQLLTQAKALGKQKRYDQALPILQRARALTPGNYKIHLELGWTFEGLKQPAKALEAYKTAYDLYLQNNANDPIVVSDLAQDVAASYRQLGKFEEAIGWLLKAVAVEPDSAMIHYNLGIYYQKSNDSQKAIPEFLKAIQLKPDYLKARLALSDSYTDIGDNANALSCLQSATASSPGSADAHYKLGVVYRHSGEPQKAIDEYKKALKINPNDRDAMNAVGYALTDLGQKEEAVFWYKSCLTANPDSPNAQAMSASLASLWEEIAKTSPRDSKTGPDYYFSASKDGLPRRWPLEKLPIKVYVDSGAGVAGMRDSFARLFLESLKEWTIASQGKIGFQLVPQPDLADITCSWTSDLSAAAGDGENGITDSVSVDRNHGAFEVDKAKIKIRTGKGAPGSYSFVSDDCMKATCLHEIGHALGFKGHSPNSHDMMYYKEIPAIKPVLSERDKNTLLRLYEKYPAQFSAAGL